MPARSTWGSAAVTFCSLEVITTCAPVCVAMQVCSVLIDLISPALQVCTALKAHSNARPFSLGFGLIRISPEMMQVSVISDVVNSHTPAGDQLVFNCAPAGEENASPAAIAAVIRAILTTSDPHRARTSPPPDAANGIGRSTFLFRRAL